MNTELAFQKFNDLPENLQFQVLDYMEFLFAKYSTAQKISTNENSEKSDEELTPELKQFLEKRLENYRKNPEKVIPWEEMEKKLIDKFGYAV